MDNNDLKIQVEGVLEELREMLAMHAGGIELVGVDADTGVAKIRLLGMCVGCPWSDMTLHGMVEETLIERVPGITKVENVAQ